MLNEIKAWLDGIIDTNAAEGEDATNGDFLRTFIVNFAKAVIALLDVLGEWPIDVQ